MQGGMETERLLLRRWNQGDFRAFLKFNADPRVMPLSGRRPSATLEEGERDFHRALWDQDCYAIVLKSTGEPIGLIKFQRDLRRLKVNSLSIAYKLCRDQWGNGYMTEALKAMVARAFEKRKVDVLAVSHFSGNERSRRVIEKCGFRREGVIRRAFFRWDGEVLDDVCYSILKEEYFAGKGKK